MRQFIIDTDTASDDAVAIMMALAAPDIVVDAITVVAGNVDVKQGSINARYTLEVCKAQVPVYEGCAQPWLHSLAIADWFHGADGMGGMNYPAPEQAAKGNHAVNELVERICDAPGVITLVTLGPLTNIATALAIDESIATDIGYHYVDIATGDELTRGMTVVDRLNVNDRKTNARVCFSINAARWKEQLVAALR